MNWLRVALFILISAVFNVLDAQQSLIVHNDSKDCPIFTRFYAKNSKKFTAVGSIEETSQHGESGLTVPLKANYLLIAIDEDAIQRDKLTEKDLQKRVKLSPDTPKSTVSKIINKVLSEETIRRVKAVDLSTVDTDIYVVDKGVERDCEIRKFTVYTRQKTTSGPLKIKNATPVNIYFGFYDCDIDKTAINQPWACRRIGGIELLTPGKARSKKSIKHTTVKSIGKGKKDNNFSSQVIFSAIKENLPRKKSLDRSEFKKALKNTKREFRPAFEFSVYPKVSEITVNMSNNGLSLSGKGVPDYLKSLAVSYGGGALLNAFKSPAVQKIAGAFNYDEWARVAQHDIQKREELLKKFGKKVAHVRKESSLPQEEREFLEKRKEYIKPAFNELLGPELVDKLGQQIDYPIIGLCLSGGGYRAMISSLGFLEGIQEIGVFQVVTYMATLSGSTWLMMKYLFEGKDISNLRNQMVRQVGPSDSRLPKMLPKRVPRKQIDLLEFLVPIALKWYLDDQPWNFIDVYGALLGYNLFYEPNKREQRFSSLKETFKKRADKPLPIGTAIAKHREWFEFTPFEIGSAQLNAFIPTWAFGRRFQKGRSLFNEVEMPIYYLMAIFGSAISLFTSKDIAQHIINVDMGKLLASFTEQLSLLKEAAKIVGQEAKDAQTVQEIEEKLKKYEFPEQQIITQITSQLQTVDDIQGFVNKMEDLVEKAEQVKDFIQSGQIHVPRVYNFMYQLSGVPAKFQNNPFLFVRDGGIDFNLPFPPLNRSERNVNIIIAWDASGDLLTKGPLSLQAAQNYARKHNLKFPDLSNDIVINDHNIKVFGNPDDANTLTIIYMPLLKNAALNGKLGQFEPLAEGFTATFSFQYTSEQANLLMDQVKENVIHNKDIIIDVVRRKTKAMSR